MSENHVERSEDMSVDGKLVLLRQSDGDVIIHIRGRDAIGKPASATVEFCASGGRSTNTLLALYELFEAMKKDNKENPIDTQ